MEVRYELVINLKTAKAIGIDFALGPRFPAPTAQVGLTQRFRENFATSSTWGVWRNWSTGVTPSIA